MQQLDDENHNAQEERSRFPPIPTPWHDWNLVVFWSGSVLS